MIRDVLEADGRFEVRVANNGFDAGMMVREYRPDILVLDIMLPDINGKEVCQRVRSDNTLDEVKIICISGLVEQDKIQDLLSSGPTTSCRSRSKSNSCLAGCAGCSRWTPRHPAMEEARTLRLCSRIRKNSDFQSKWLRLMKY